MMRKILAGTLSVVSSLLLVLSLAGIALAWIYNEPLTQDGITRLAEIDHELAQAQSALQDAKVELERTLRIVEASEKAMANLKDQLAEAKTIFSAMSGTMDEGLLPGLESARDNLNQAKIVIQDLQNTIRQINAIPFVNLSIPGDTLLADLIVTADSIDDEIVQIQSLVQKAVTFLNDASYLASGDFTETKQNLQAFTAVVDQYEQKVGGWRADVARVAASLPRWIDLASIGLTVFLLWFGFSQFGLLLHGLNIGQGGDPLAAMKKTLANLRKRNDGTP
jgi:hypothetical protein